MEPSSFDEVALFQSLQRNNVRALLIGRRALVLLGLPVLTADYDFWLHIDDIALFNETCEPFGLQPSRPPHEARARGRYVLENDEHIDVLVARSIATLDGTMVTFEALWERRRAIDLGSGIDVAIPTIDDLILTKQLASRPKDLEDIRLLRALREEES